MALSASGVNWAEATVQRDVTDVSAVPGRAIYGADEAGVSLLALG